MELAVDEREDVGEWEEGWGEGDLGGRGAGDEVQSFGKGNAEGGSVGGVVGRWGKGRGARGSPDEGGWGVGGEECAVVDGEDAMGGGDEAVLPDEVSNFAGERE